MKKKKNECEIGVRERKDWEVGGKVRSVTVKRQGNVEIAEAQGRIHDSCNEFLFMLLWEPSCIHFPLLHVYISY